MTVLSITTDFGLSNGFVGVMKGVIYSIAPTAAHLAAGVPLRELGTPVTDPLCLDLPHPEKTGHGWLAHITVIDIFGNLTTDLPAEALADRRNVLWAIARLANWSPWWTANIISKSPWSMAALPGLWARRSVMKWKLSLPIRL